MSSDQELNYDQGDYWEIYTTYVDDKPAVILVDVGIAEKIPLDGMPSLAWLWVHLKSPDEDGFPSEDEDMRLNDLEDLITEALAPDESRYVGRITSDGRREFYFYSRDVEEFKSVVTKAMSSFPDYQFEIDEADDENGTHYTDVLSPSVEDQQQIQNHHQIFELEQNGDNLETPRPIFHRVNFPTAEDREEFIAAASSMAYSVVEKLETELELPFAVELTKVDAADPETIDQITFELFDLAGTHQGQYECWRSDVVK